MLIHIKNCQTDTPSNKPWEFYVDRRTILGNPFILEDEELRDLVCDQYQTWFYQQLYRPEFMGRLLLMQQTLQAHGRLNLWCNCFPKRCHAETIRRWIYNSMVESELITPNYLERFMQEDWRDAHEMRGFGRK